MVGHFEHTNPFQFAYDCFFTYFTRTLEGTIFNQKLRNLDSLGLDV
jgi:hypothetical protein